jgi:type I restriction enzyme, S subunit
LTRASLPFDLRVPPGWEVQPFGRVVNRSQESGQPNARPLSVFLDQGVVPRDSRDDNFNQLGADLSKYLVVRDGDIVFNKLRTWQGGLGVSKFEGIVSPAYFVCRPYPTVEPRFLHYLLRSRVYLEELTRISKWMPPSQFDIAWDDLRSLPVLLPPLAIQRTIADFLDHEATQIDALITNQRCLVGLLNERIDALVKHQIGVSDLAGGRSLRTVPLKRLLRKVNRPYEEGSPIVTAYRDGEVNARAVRRAEGYTLASNESTYQGVKRGDVVLHGLDGFAGAIGTSLVDGSCSPVYQVCEPIDGNKATYIARMLRILALDGYIGAHATSVRERAVDLRNWELLGSIPVPVVAQAEQTIVVELIERAAPTKQATNRISFLLDERRQAIATAAVTGEFEIPVVAA